MNQDPDNPQRAAGSVIARVLVVEPFESIRTLLAMALRQSGHDVVALSDGAAAIRALETTTFDKVVVGSPVSVKPGPDSSLFLEAVVELRRELGFCLIVVTTHVDNVQVLNAAVRADACAVMAKPFDALHLLAEIVACSPGAHTPTRWSGISESAIAEVGG